MALSNQSVVIDILGNVAGFVSDMDRATRAAKKSADDMQRQFRDVGRVIGGALAAGLTAVVAGTANAIHSMDKLADSAKKVGVAASTFSELKFAVEQSGATVEALDTGLKTLAKRMAEQPQLFAQLGISVKDVNGELKGTDVVLKEVADRFKSYKNGAGEAALAQQLFGRSGTELVQVLNEGSEGINAMAQEARDLGIAFSDDAAAAAQQFGDNMDKLKAITQGFFQNIANQVLPSLVNLQEVLIEDGKAAVAAGNDVSVFASALQWLLKIAVSVNAAFQIVGKTIAAVAASVTQNGQAMLAVITGIATRNEALVRAGVKNLTVFKDLGSDIAEEIEKAGRRIAAIEKPTVAAAESSAAALGLLPPPIIATGAAAAAAAPKTKELAHQLDAVTVSATQAEIALADAEALIEEIASGSIDRAAEQALRLRMALDEVSDPAMRRELEQWIETVESVEPAVTEAAESATYWSDMWGSAMDSVAGAFAGFIDGSTTSFKDFGHKLIDIAKRFLADLVQRFIATQLRLNVAANFSGGGGGAGGYAQAATGGQGWMSLLSGGGQASGFLGSTASQLYGYGVSNALGTGYGMYGTAANYAAASAYGPPAAMAGSGVGFGAMAGGAMGVAGGLGLLYMGAQTGNPAWGAAGGAAGAAMAGAGLSMMGFAQAGAAVGGPWGLIIGAVIGIIASFFMKEKPPSLDVIGSGLVGQAPYANLAPGMTFDSALGGGAIASIDSVSREARDKFIEGIVQFDQAIAQFLSPEQLAEIKQRIATSSQTFRNGAITVEDVLGGRLSLVLQSVAPEVAEYVNSLTDIEDKINGFGAAMVVWRDFEGPNTLGLASFGETMAALQSFTREGENLGQTIQRLVPVVSFMDATMDAFGITFEGARLAFIEFADDLVKALGGVERAGQLFNNAFAAIFSPSEIAGMNLERVQRYATEQFADIGLGPNATRAEIRAVIERAMRTGDDALLKEALEAAEAFGMLGAALEAVAQAAGTATNGIIILADTNTLTRPGGFDRSVDFIEDGPIPGSASAIEEFAVATISAGQAAIEAAEHLRDLADEYRNAQNGIQEWLDAQRFMDTSSLTPAERLAEAARQFDVKLVAAQAGDLDALRDITGIAQTYLEEGRGFYSSSDNYTSIEARVRGALEGLVAQDFTKKPTAGEQAIIDTIERESAIDRLRYDEMISLLSDVADESGDGTALLQRIIDARAGRVG